MDLILKLWNIQGITFSVFEPILLTAKEILIIQDNFRVLTAHASSKRVDEKAFFKENENKLVNFFCFEKIWKNGEIQEHVFPWTWLESCKLYIFANFIYYRFGWWLLLLYTIFFVVSTSRAKCYSRPWLCPWLFSEETLWVACEKLFLEVLNNNNNNNNNYNNNKDLFASSIFAMALRAIG